MNSLLQFDLLARNDVSVRESDLISLSTLKSKEWDYSLPTLVSDYPEPSIIFEESKVIRKFLKRHRCFSGVDMSNILIAGGSVTASVLNQKHDTDIDLFIYGLKMEEVYGRMEKLVRDLNLGDRGIIVKTDFATTIEVKTEYGLETIQIVHRLYNTPSEILHGFDMGSCSVGILLNEARVVTTSLGKASLEYMINVVDLSKMSLNYEQRLLKYYNRGFSIVLPDLDIEKFKHSKVYPATVGLFDFYSFRTEKGNAIQCRIYIDAHRPLSDYGPAFTTAHVLASMNISKLYSGGKLVYFKRWRSIDELVKCLTDNVISPYLNKHMCRALSRGNYRYGVIRMYLGEEKALHYAERVIRMKEPEELYVIEDDLYEDIMKVYTEKLKVYNENGGYVPQWVTVDPASQITGSFHPRSITKEQFYGPYLKE